jgi:hypothetical protein
MSMHGQGSAVAAPVRPPSGAGLAEAIRSRRLDGGAFAERPGGEPRPDATAWAAIALTREPGAASEALGAAERLAAVQQDDGSVPVAPSHPDAAWPTPLAVLAWQAAGGCAAARDRAVRFLLASAGAVVPREDGPAILGHDPSITGWAWNAGAHSWVEPTALAVLALQGAGLGGHLRVADGVRLLLDRQLPHGGWNYGNTTVYGAELAPQADATGVALAALRGLASETAVSRSLVQLEAAVRVARTPLALGWGIVGLARWDRRPPEAAGWIAECLARNGRYGEYGTTELALLHLAAGTGGAFGQ